MRGTGRFRGTFSGRMTALVLVLVAGTVVLCLGAVLWLTAERVEDHAAQNALGIARTVAADPDVRAEVARQAARETLDAAALRTGPLQRHLEAVRRRTGALFVIATEDRGLRLAHPVPARIGERVSTEPTALGGVEGVFREHGTLGESVRAKVPVYAPGSDRVVGEVSAGVGIEAVSDRVRAAVGPIALAGAAALALGAAAAALLKRRLRRLTLGLEPEEMVSLARDQAAVLYGVADGVVGIAPDGRITVRNRAARILLGLPSRQDSDDVVGRHYRRAGLPEALVAAVATVLDGGSAPGGLRLRVQGRPLEAGVVAVRRDGADLGAVALLRDLSDVEELGGRLQAVEAMASALRVQRHEFANRLHAVSGLLAAGEVGEARDFVGQLVASGPLREPVANIAAVGDTFLRAFLSAKGVQAQEAGVALRVGEDTALFGGLADPQDAAAVVGNLLDNAVRAAAEAPPREPGGRWVEVDLLSEGDTLHVAVTDSGGGVVPGLDVFAEGATTRPAGPGPGEGGGLGLPLSRRIARHLGGDVWLADAGGRDGGAVFCARLPGTVERESE